MTLQWIRFGFASVLLLGGILAIFTTTVGIYRFNYVLNRIHVAAKCDTLGLLLIISSLVIMTGFNFTSLKYLLIVLFVWVANPVSSHLIAYLEVSTNEDVEKECEVVRIHDDNH